MFSNLKKAGKFHREVGHKMIVFLFASAMALSCSGAKVATISEKQGNPTTVSVALDSSDSPSEPGSSDPSLSGIENIKPYLPLIKRYARAYGLDWRLILAVIYQESRFQHDAVSPKGAYGLLQIMPSTGEELVSSVSHINGYITPEQNIIAGIHYLWAQFNRFYTPEMDSLECLRLALAAYNAGPGRILDAQQIASFLGENPNSWESIKMALPLLSRKYHTLHAYIWGIGRPRSGYFENPGETISYVEKILKHYKRYKNLK